MIHHGPFELFILDDDGAPVVEKDFIKWAVWMERGRNVACEVIGDSEVSTIFLGMNLAHRIRKLDAPPLLWETMVFGGTLDMQQNRCSGDIAQAFKMHAEMVQRVQEAMV